MNKKDVLILLILWLVAIYIWSLPIQNNHLPYGEVDAAAHYGVGSYMAYKGSYIDLPHFLYKYRNDNQHLKGTLWYPPQFHTNIAIMNSLGDDANSYLDYLFLAIISVSFILSVYFLIGNMYGTTTAFLASFFLIFSLRDYFGYLWGQWPQLISLSFIPLILYFYYKYLEIIKTNKNTHSTYLYLTVILIAAQFLIHPMGMFHSLAALSIYTLLVCIKNRKILLNFKSITISIIIFLVITLSFAPLQFGNVVNNLLGGHSEGKGLNIDNIDRLFSWFKKLPDNRGYPDFYYSYSYLYNKWILFFIFVGALFILIRRSSKDLLIISWLISLYILLHLDVIGMGSRIHRSLAAESQLFYSLAAIGIIALPKLLSSFVVQLKKYKNILTYSLVLIFVLLTLFTSAKATYSQFDNAYAGLSRITPFQYEASIWMRHNIDENANISNIGTINLAKKRWIQAISFRHIIDSFEDTKPNYYMVDYSDLILMGNKLGIEQLKTFESNIDNTSKIIYNKNNIKVYKIDE